MMNVRTVQYTGTTISSTEHYGNNRISNVNETIECNNMTHTNSKVRFFLNFK
jgi:hypothetical protein